MASFSRPATPPKCAPPELTVGGEHAIENGRCTPRDRFPAACVKRRSHKPFFVDEFVTLVDYGETNTVKIDSNRLPLTALHSRTIAVQVAVAGETRVLLGRGRFESDISHGNVLKIKFPLSAGCEMMIVENRWNGEVLCGKSLGCDYLIRL